MDQGTTISGANDPSIFPSGYISLGLFDPATFGPFLVVELAYIYVVKVEHLVGSLVFVHCLHGC